MSTSFEQAKKLLKSWETSITLPCSLCERENVLFRAEYDANEGRKPLEILSGYAWPISEELRKKLGSAIKYFANGMFAVCHNCGKNRAHTFARMAEHEELPQIKATLFIASKISSATP